MATKNFTDQLFTLDRDVVFLRLTIPTNGSSAISQSGVRGQGYVAARTDVGVMTLTPISNLQAPVRPNVTVSLGLAAVAAKFAQVGTYNTTTGVITINCVNGSGVASEWPTADADAVLNVCISFSNTSQLPNHSV